MSLRIYQYTTSLSLYCIQMNQLSATSFSSSAVVQTCHSSTLQTIPSHDGTCLTRYSLPEKYRPDLVVGGAGTASCPVSRHFSTPIFCNWRRGCRCPAESCTNTAEAFTASWPKHPHCSVYFNLAY